MAFLRVRGRFPADGESFSGTTMSSQHNPLSEKWVCITISSFSYRFCIENETLHLKGGAGGIGDDGVEGAGVGGNA